MQKVKSLNSNEVVVTKGTECVKDYAESEITITAVNETSKSGIDI